MTQPQEDPQTHLVQPPPEDDALIVAVAGLLIVGAGTAATAAAIAGLVEIPEQAVELALRIAERGRAHLPRAIGSGPAASAQRSQEAHYRAAYILAASRRIWAQLRKGSTPLQAIRAEAGNWQAHQAASRNRQLAAAEVTRLSLLYGPTLGWYARLDGNETPECAAADGCNFSALRRPVIGWPGSVHRYCRCRPGPAHQGAAQSVDAAVARLVRRSALGFATPIQRSA